MAFQQSLFGYYVAVVITVPIAIAVSFLYAEIILKRITACGIKLTAASFYFGITIPPAFLVAYLFFIAPTSKAILNATEIPFLFGLDVMREVVLPIISIVYLVVCFKICAYLTQRSIG